MAWHPVIRRLVWRSRRWRRLAGRNPVDPIDHRALVASVEADLVRRAFRDPLTDLPNRALFLDRLEHALVVARREPVGPAVLFVDLDGFKQVNDRRGHAAGDRLLVAVAHRIRSCLRAGDTVARYGGDEFTVLLERVPDQSVAVGVAERLLSALGLPFPLDDGEIRLAASIGLTYAASARDRPDELVHQADLAMYQAKRRSGAGFGVFAHVLDGPPVGGASTLSPEVGSWH